MDKVIIYTQDGCNGCIMAIEFFKENQIGFIERKLSTQEKLIQFKQDGGIATPYILLNDKSLIGFEELELKNLLQELGWLK